MVKSKGKPLRYMFVCPTFSKTFRWLIFNIVYILKAKATHMYGAWSTEIRRLLRRLLEEGSNLVCSINKWFSARITLTNNAIPEHFLSFRFNRLITTVLFVLTQNPWSDNQFSFLRNLLKCAGFDLTCYRNDESCNLPSRIHPQLKCCFWWTMNSFFFDREESYRLYLFHRSRSWIYTTPSLTLFMALPKRI